MLSMLKWAAKVGAGAGPERETEGSPMVIKRITWPGGANDGELGISTK